MTVSTGIVMNMQMKILNICSAVKQSDGGWFLIPSKRSRYKVGTCCPPFFNRNNRNPEWFAQQRALNRQAAKDAAKADIPNKTMKHIVDGEMRGKAAKGGHSTTTGRVRVDKVIKENPNGTYEAKISIYDPKTKRYVPKTGNDSVSTMFPDHWSKDRIKVESDGAFKNKKPTTAYPSKNKGKIE